MITVKYQKEIVNVISFSILVLLCFSVSQRPILIPEGSRFPQFLRGTVGLRGRLRFCLLFWHSFHVNQWLIFVAQSFVHSFMENHPCFGRWLHGLTLGSKYLPYRLNLPSCLAVGSIATCLVSFLTYLCGHLDQFCIP